MFGHSALIRQAILADTRLIEDIFRLEGGQYNNPEGSLAWSFPSLLGHFQGYSC
jgi:hypothetical protein